VDPTPILGDVRNDSKDSTVASQKVTNSKVDPRVLHTRNFGKRRLQTLLQWEGVVESVEVSTFECRLVPIVDGRPDQTRIEFTKFSFDDLSDDDDHGLVAPGSVFYWTIGRARNAAGTATNVSLVRFRRLPPLTKTHSERAEREAEAMLQALGESDGPEPSRT